MKHNILCSALLLSLLALPANAEFTALERGLTSGRIIHSVSDNAYLAKSGQALTEASIAGLTASDYTKTGLVADGNTRLILRYKSSEPGSVAFSVSPAISGSRLELFTNRQEITAPVSTVEVDGGYQVSAVFIAPETWPENISFPSGKFTVTAEFTPSDGGAPAAESLELTLQAAPVVLIHGAFSNNEDTFGYGGGKKAGVWNKLSAAGLTVTGWNYDNKKSPTQLITNNSNGLTKVIADALDALNGKGIAATRVDLVTQGTGGLIARQYLRSDIDTGTKTPNSYGQGNVRRVVTIASPNRGTPVASYLAGKFSTMPSSWQNWSAKSWWENIGYQIIKLLALRNYDVNSLLNDMATDSSFVGMGYPGVPFHAIYGKVKDDNEQINKLFDDIVNANTVSLSKINWLPQQTVNMLTSSKLQMISSVLRRVSDDMRFKELFGAFFGDEDHDLIVSESSARDVFPEHALTSFTGLGTHNHIMIACQDDTGDRVLELLRGDSYYFMINTVSPALYDRMFSVAAETSYTRYINEIEKDLNEYIDDSLTFEASKPVVEYLGDDGDKPSIQSVKISGASAAGFSEDVYVVIENELGEAKFFAHNFENAKSFDISLWSNNQDKGIFYVYIMTVQNGEIKMSSTKEIVLPPLLYDVTEVSFTNGGKLYGHVGDEIHAGLIAYTDDGNFDISAPIFGLAEYTVSDPSVAEITEYGEVKLLKEGTVKLTASAYGKTASTEIIVKTSAAEEDTTKDIDVNGSNGGSTGDDSSNGGSTGNDIKGAGGGCDVGFGALVLLSLVPLFRKYSR